MKPKTVDKDATLRIQKVGGGKKTTGIIFCIELADDKLPDWVKPGDRENIQSNDNNLVAGWRDLMHIPYPKAVN